MFLAALLAVLTPASSAWAECAWVLWIDVAPTAATPEQARTRVAKWVPDHAATTKAECEKVRAARALPDWHVCLPDTIDPRGPKSTGR